MKLFSTVAYPITELLAENKQCDWTHKKVD